MARTIRKSADGILARDGSQVRTIRRRNVAVRRQSTRVAIVRAALLEV